MTGVVFLTRSGRGPRQRGGQGTGESAAKRLALFDVQAGKAPGGGGRGWHRSPRCCRWPWTSPMRPPPAAGRPDKAIEHYGTPRALIHAAAVLKEVSMLDVTFENWRREVDIILQAAFISVEGRVARDGRGAQGKHPVLLSSGSALGGFVKGDGVYARQARPGGPHAGPGPRSGGIQHRGQHDYDRQGDRHADVGGALHARDVGRRGAPTSRLAPAFAFLAGIDADFATGQRFNAFQMSEAMRSVGRMNADISVPGLLPVPRKASRWRASAAHPGVEVTATGRTCCHSRATHATITARPRRPGPPRSGPTGTAPPASGRRLL